MRYKFLAMSNFIIHKANERGEADYGWLKAKYSFSFSQYYDAKKIHFGVLRVLNNDIVAGGMGFGMHPHDNMEIITIPLSGALAHKDNLGNGTTIQTGDIQVMSAGTGIRHSEFNANETEACELLQIWLFPNKNNVLPRYDQMSYLKNFKVNEFNEILSPEKKDHTVWIHQNAWFYLAKFDNDVDKIYQLNDNTNGCYIFVISGEFELNGQKLNERDAIGFWDVHELNIKANTNEAQILIMEIPMNVN